MLPRKINKNEQADVIEEHLKWLKLNGELDKNADFTETIIFNENESLLGGC